MSDAGVRSWLKRFGVALAAVAVCIVAGTVVVPVFGAYVGLLAGGVVAGLAFPDRPFVEAGLAGCLGGIPVVVLGGLPLSAVGSLLSLSSGSFQAEVVALGAVLGFGLAALGAHFGNDVRDGLTRPVE